MECPACHFENPDRMKFCGECGTALALPDLRPQDGAAPSAADAERRHLTVLFCDVADSTALAERLDPEELRDVIREYQTASGDVIREYGGHIAQFLGDGIVVYFGFPTAHEDDARRAVHTGLGIVTAVEELNRRLLTERHIELAVRVGIHTGEVVAGRMGGTESAERIAVGQVPNIAARLQAIAHRNTVTTGPDTHRLTQGFFEFDFLGERNLKGVSVPMGVYQPLRETGAVTRFEVAATRTLVPLVGRQAELALLLECSRRAHQGSWQAVLVSGGAGIGKSRLVHMFKVESTVDDSNWLVAQCSPFHQNTAFHPLVELFRRMLGVGRGGSVGQDLAALEAALAPHADSIPEIVPLMATMLSVPAADQFPPLETPPPERRQKTFEGLLAILEHRVKEPLVVVIEDLHWVDPTTSAFLDLLVRRRPPAHLLLCLTSRTPLGESWDASPHLTRVTLDRLDDAQVEALARSIAGKPLPPELMREVVQKTDGVPLFVEELIKMVLESDLVRERERDYELGAPLTQLAIPATLQESLVARLDRLASARDVVQIGAVIGRQFEYGVLQAVASADEARLRRNLTQLVEAELLYQSGTPPASSYQFKHALIQDAAYGIMLKSVRRQFHGRVAQVLADKSVVRETPPPEVLAHHYTEAGSNDQAIDHWVLAGRKAFDQAGSVEAERHLNQARSLLELLPEADRDRKELAVLTSLGQVQFATKGYLDPDVEQTYNRALELCEKIGDADTPELFWDLWGLGAVYQARGDLERSLEKGYQLLRIARAARDPALIMEADFGIGSNLLFLGKLREARAQLEDGIARWNELGGQTSPTSPVHGVIDSGVSCRIWRILTLWLLGYPDEALAESRDTMSVARELHPFMHAACLSFEALLYQVRGDPQATRERSADAIALSTEHGWPAWLTWGTLVHAWARAQQGELNEGLAQMRECLDGYLSGGNALLQTYFLYLLADVHTMAGSFPEGLQATSDGLDAAERTGERFWEAELLRKKGELTLLEQGEAALEEVERDFRLAIEVAATQQAKSLELRAASSLANFRREHRTTDKV